MAQLILKDATVTVNGANMTGIAKKVTMNYKADLHDSTVMGSSSRRRIAGLTEWDFQIEFVQDYEVGAVDATLFSLVGAAKFPIKVRPTSAIISPTNPEFQGDVVLETYQPVDGAVGELSTIKASFKSASDLTRATA